MVTQYYISWRSTDVHVQCRVAWTVQSSVVEVITVVSITVAMHPPTQA